MKVKIAIIAILMILIGCKRSQKGFEKIVPIDGIERIEKITESDRFSKDGEFAYNVQYAHFKTNQVESRGPCDIQTFNNEFEAFNWTEQLTEANKLGTVSPTLSVRHNPTKHELGISVVGNNEYDYGFWIFFGKQGTMELVEVLDEKAVKPYINKFFNRDFENLQNEFNNLSID